jgi:predicted lipoprotein with Yx(FWY)xxD motif
VVRLAITLASTAVLAIAAVVVAPALVGDDEEATAVAAGADAAHKKAKRAKVTVIKTRFGKMLADQDGFALYSFSRDGKDRTKCKGNCASAWPPFKTRRDPRASRKLEKRKLGTAKRPNRAKQVTYNGHPLYYYVDDREPKQVLCQDVVEFGGRWLVVSRRGKPIR